MPLIKERKGAVFILRDELDKLTADDFKQIEAYLEGARIHKKKARPYQRKTIRRINTSVMNSFYKAMQDEGIDVVPGKSDEGGFTYSVRDINGKIHTDYSFAKYVYAKGATIAEDQFGLKWGWERITANSLSRRRCGPVIQERNWRGS